MFAREVKRQRIYAGLTGVSRTRCLTRNALSPGDAPRLDRVQPGSLRAMSASRDEVLTAEQKTALEAELAELEGPRRAAAIEAIAHAHTDKEGCRG